MKLTACGALAAAALAVALLSGCSRPSAVGRGSAAANGASGSPQPIKAGMVTDCNGVDDQSFNAAVWDGLNRAYANLKLPGKPRVLESREPADYSTNLSTLAEQGNNVVMAVGYLTRDAFIETAPRHPKTHFVLIDESGPAMPNCRYVRYREQEGAFLAGYLAARMTKTGVIGFIGGMTSDVMTRFHAGYAAGAEFAAKGRRPVRVVAKLVESWTDVAKAAEIARTMMSRDHADIMLVGAGAAAIGALDAIAQHPGATYAIGVDKDQDGMHPGRILTSVMKSIDQCAYDAVLQVAHGQWKGGEQYLGLREGGMKLSPMRFTKQLVPPAVLADLDAVRRGVIDGKITVPTRLQETSAPGAKSE